MKVLYAVSEARPFVVSGDLADVAGSLPQALRKRMVEYVSSASYDSIPQNTKTR